MIHFNQRLGVKALSAVPSSIVPQLSLVLTCAVARAEHPLFYWHTKHKESTTVGIEPAVVLFFLERRSTRRKCWYLTVFPMGRSWKQKF